METETGQGTDYECPNVELTLLEEEKMIFPPNQRFSRVLSLFEFRKGGLLTPVQIEAESPTKYEDVEVVGLVGTLHGKEGLFAQCAWFGNNDVDWFWCHITKIQRVEIKSDIRFRRGERCAWLQTPHGDYAMLMPRNAYVGMWEESLHNHSQGALASRVQIWPPKGARPAWWSNRWKDSWPWYEQPIAKMTHAVPSPWVRLGPQGDTRNPGEPLSNLHHLDPWVIAPDSGRKSTLDTEDNVSVSSDGSQYV